VLAFTCCAKKECPLATMAMGMVPNVKLRDTRGMQTSNNQREPGVWFRPRGRGDRLPMVFPSEIPGGKPQYCFLYSNQAARSAGVT
jgi:hypothetical protein